MKVPGGSPGQVLSFEEVQERQRAQDAKRRQRQLRAEALGWVSPTAPSPTDEEKWEKEQEGKAALRRFLDWSASVSPRPTQPKRSGRYRRAARSYALTAELEKNQKGQKITRMA